MDAQEQLRQLYDRFLEVCPNSKDEFDPTIENAQRWQWHIKQFEQRGKPQPFEVERPTLDQAALIEERSFLAFEDMPEYMKGQFSLIASFFPGRQLYATGSRVTGEYMEEWSGQEVKEIREKLRKANKGQSDYDVTFELKPGEDIAAFRKALPPGADIVRPQAGAKILPIPMWDFSKLPTYEHNNVLELFSRNAWGALMKIHNEYKLSPTVFCCNDGPVRRWFAYAINEGIIKPQTDANEDNG